MRRIPLWALRPSRAITIRIALGAAAALALTILVLRADDSPGIEVQRLDPPPGVDEIRVEVAGAVARPGVYTVQPGDRTVDAIALAGGLEPDADTAALNLSMRLRDEDRVVVPRLGERSPLLDINSATAEQLDELPGIGPVYSAAIVEAREQGGRFETTEDLIGRDVVPEHVYDRIRELITAR
ncbi:MAG: ComEA family DNA-binding protein [Chloroflexi bacterium]|nr:ComEA family DNA-binding protein [Chloroflexota bacterium]